MRTRVLLFVLFVLIFLAVAPGVNALLKKPWSEEADKEHRWTWSSHESYKLDFATKWLAIALVRLGISLDPTQTIVGYSGWLFLGDRHSHKLTVGRRGQTENDILQSCDIAEASLAWAIWLRRHGVRLYKIMVAPDKSTIYPEYLPDWAKPSQPSATDALFTCSRDNIHIDVRRPLLSAKQDVDVHLYYRTDTHWNSLGSGYAFSAFLDGIRKENPGIKWQKWQPRVERVDSRYGGDLSRFLFLQDYLQDAEPKVESLNGFDTNTTVYHFDSDQTIKRGRNMLIDSPNAPVRVESPNALNRRKVLWLRDSFGTALSPYMASTFTDTVQIHWSDAFVDSGRLFVDLVETWRPDYVFVTVVERNSRNFLFSVMPPDEEM